MQGYDLNEHCTIYMVQPDPIEVLWFETGVYYDKLVFYYASGYTPSYSGCYGCSQRIAPPDGVTPSPGHIVWSSDSYGAGPYAGPGGASQKSGWKIWPGYCGLRRGVPGGL